MRDLVRSVATAAAALALAGGLVACGGDDDAPTTGERPSLPADAPELWNPCDGLDPEAVSTSFGVRFTVRTGTDAEPQCSFAPTAEGDPAVDVSYQLYAGTLDDLLRTFGNQEVAGRTQVASPEVPGADDARVISDVADDGTLAVTGFVRNGRLVQVVNALQPPPFQRPRIVTAVTAVLGGLAEHASESGITDDAPGASPTDQPTQ
ncbi:hypothetical protein [Nocardioides litoris]|uniref:hypothetical protein n=1 Tax=Nocardioides litoris TaxID=1926648 RepID=UPI0011221731|nr:hypothetical protein [Nocardioides litoris]